MYQGGYLPTGYREAYIQGGIYPLLRRPEEVSAQRLLLSPREAGRGLCAEVSFSLLREAGRGLCAEVSTFLLREAERDLCAEVSTGPLREAEKAAQDLRGGLTTLLEGLRVFRVPCTQVLSVAGFLALRSPETSAQRLLSDPKEPGNLCAEASPPP